MRYYAYVPDKDGGEPLGTEGKLIVDKPLTRRGTKNFIGKAYNLFGARFVAYYMPEDRWYNQERKGWTLIYNVGGAVVSR